MALWDLAGKAYNVPAYQLLGGRFRDRIRLYADTTESHDPKVYGERLKKRRDEGFTWLKMDLGIDLVEKVPGAVTAPAGVTQRTSTWTKHMFTGMELTEKGIGLMCDYVAQIREMVGWDIPLAADHFGHIGVNSCIRLGKALEKYNLAWLEDMIPWTETELWKQITLAVNIPTLTGEDIYLKEPFIELARQHAVDILHPDLATAGTAQGTIMRDLRMPPPLVILLNAKANRRPKRKVRAVVPAQNTAIRCRLIQKRRSLKRTW